MVGWQSRVLTLFVVIAWVVLGPIGMAFDCCAAMLLLCDGAPCGVTATFDSAPLVAPPLALSAASSTFAQHPLTAVLLTLDPPPKLVRLSA